MRLLLAITLVVVGCEATPSPAPSPAPSPTRTAGPPASATVRPAPPLELVYGEFVRGEGPIVVRAIALDGGRTRELARVAEKRDARFALSPDGRRLLVFEREDQHRERTTRWRVRLVELGGGERELIAPQVSRYEERPWDVGWSASGTPLLASPPALERIEADGSRVRVQPLSEGTVGVTFRDAARPGLLVSQTANTLSVLVVAGDGRSARRVWERPLAGFNGYARRPGGDEIVELASRFDGTVTLALLRADGSERDFVLEGPRIEGAVELVGTAPDGVYLAWPITREDPVAVGKLGLAFLYRVGYDGALQLVDSIRNWTPAAPLGISPDGGALLVPSASRPNEGRFAVAVCCAERPARPLLPPGDYFVVGWLGIP